MSASSTRGLRAALPALRSAGPSRAASTYVPSGRRGRDIAEPSRPPRPAHPGFWTGKPELAAALDGLNSTLKGARAQLRKQHVWPLPPGFPTVPAPGVSWRSLDDLGIKVRSRADERELAAALSALHHTRHLAEVAGSHDVAEEISAAVACFQKSRSTMTKAEKDELGRSGSGLDALGRAYAVGSRKESSARVWLTPTKTAQEVAKTEGEVTAQAVAQTPIPTGEILVNHLPLAAHFGRPAEREAVLRPLRLTGLLGAYNIFALVRGGGPTGQSGAIALAIARAIRNSRPDTWKVLINDNALFRDPRMVERKKTGREKARKRYTWVKR